MLPLEQITKGTRITGLNGSTPVTILDAQWHGSAALEVTYKDDGFESLIWDMDFKDGVEPAGEVAFDKSFALREIHAVASYRGDNNQLDTAVFRLAMALATVKNDAARLDALNRFSGFLGVRLLRSIHRPCIHTGS